jgi:hypothetical protein
MPAKNEPAPPPDKWTSFGRVPLRAEDAVECGWSHDAARQIIDAAFPGRDGITLAEARAALAGPASNGDAADPADPARLAMQLVEEVADYRAERARVAGEHQAIRLAKVNLKKMLKGSEVGIDHVRALAGDLGWSLREDEEGVTVPVNELIPYFRRPVVRALLEAKMRQVNLAPRAGEGE